jgi:hypothetical protein
MQIYFIPLIVFVAVAVLAIVVAYRGVSRVTWFDCATDEPSQTELGDFIMALIDTLNAAAAELATLPDRIAADKAAAVAAALADAAVTAAADKAQAVTDAVAAAESANQGAADAVAAGVAAVDAVVAPAAAPAPAPQ